MPRRKQYGLSDATAKAVYGAVVPTTVATIDASGVVYGSYTGGTTNISYSAGSCPAVRQLAVTVTTLPAITGPTGVFVSEQQ